jgi:large subunit ribosomal protein L6
MEHEIQKGLQEYILIPENVKIELNGFTLIVSHNQKITKKEYNFSLVTPSFVENKIILTIPNTKRKIKALLYTYKSLIINQIKGVMEGFTYSFVIRAYHFPMNVTQDEEYLIIQNFNGKKNKILVKKGDAISITLYEKDFEVSSVSKEKIGEFYTRMQEKLKFKGFDKRIFQDGIYLISK